MQFKQTRTILEQAEAAVLKQDCAALQEIYRSVKNDAKQLSLFLNEPYVKKERPLLYLLKQKKTDKELFNFYMEAGADVNASYSKKDFSVFSAAGKEDTKLSISTIFTYAIATKKVTEALAMLRYGADVNVKSEDGRPEICKLINGLYQEISGVYYEEAKEFLNQAVLYGLNTDMGTCYVDSPLFTLIKVLPWEGPLIRLWLENCKDIGMSENAGIILNTYVKNILQTNNFSTEAELHLREMKDIISNMEFILSFNPDINRNDNTFNETIGHLIVTKLRGTSFSALASMHMGSLSTDDCLTLLKFMVVHGLNINLKDGYEKSIFYYLKINSRINKAELEKITQLYDSRQKRKDNIIASVGSCYDNDVYVHDF